MIANLHQNIDPGSFRDPSGVVFKRDGKVYRQINPCYKEQYELLMSSGLYDRLVKQNLMVAHRIVDEAGIDEKSYLVIEPEIVPLISYPYEWCFGQLKAAALTTLRTHRLALDNGMILKDASAYNIQFLCGQPVLIDTLSFDFYKEGDPWVAYGQFCRHFFAPLFLMVYTDIRLSQLSQVYIDGIPLDLASRLLSGKGGFAAKTHIHWHAKTIEKHGQAGHSTQDGTRRISISKFKITAMIDSMISTVEKLNLKNVRTEWDEYYLNTNYTDSASKSKMAIISEYLGIVSPQVTWDLGANDGTYSQMALLNDDCFVAAFDVDPLAVERNYANVKRSSVNMLPLLLDLTNPSPSIGFAGQERRSLPERQKPDCILMLAVVHHLAISNNLPLGMIAKWLVSLSDNLIIEFVPKSDSQVQVLLATRDDIFSDYTEDDFEKAFKDWFTVEKKQNVVDSERILYLMTKNGKN